MNTRSGGNKNMLSLFIGSYVTNMGLNVVASIMSMWLQRWKKRKRGEGGRFSGLKRINLYGTAHIRKNPHYLKETFPMSIENSPFVLIDRGGDFVIRPLKLPWCYTRFQEVYHSSTRGGETLALALIQRVYKVCVKF